MQSYNDSFCHYDFIRWAFSLPVHKYHSPHCSYHESEKLLKMQLDRCNRQSLFVCLFVFGATATQWAKPSSLIRFLDHTQRRITVGRTPLDEWSARRRDLSLTTHNRQTSIPPVVFEPTVSAGERPHTYFFDRAATGTGYRQSRTLKCQPKQRCTQPTRCNDFRLLIFLFIYLNLLHMFRATNSPIFSSTFWLFLQLLVQCTDIAADRWQGWNGTGVPFQPCCLLHLVGCLHLYSNDARSHKCQPKHRYCLITTGINAVWRIISYTDNPFVTPLRMSLYREGISTFVCSYIKCVPTKYNSKIHRRSVAYNHICLANLGLHWTVILFLLRWIWPC